MFLLYTLRGLKQLKAHLKNEGPQCIDERQRHVRGVEMLEEADPLPLQGNVPPLANLHVMCLQKLAELGGR